MPHKPKVGTTTIRCDVVIEWDEPTTGGFAIQKYKVQLKLGNFYQTVETCEKDPKSRRCRIPMATLRQQPYNLKLEERIVARVLAENHIGWSDPSEFDLRGGPTVY